VIGNVITAIRCGWLKLGKRRITRAISFQGNTQKDEFLLGGRFLCNNPEGRRHNS
jgi:hypothetical protein